ncbi:DUF4190 domain-containing protein, partial [Streptomyces sp. SID89]|nr:DUF4190 domain-containing protein [Streptomyces sp. SID89]
MTDGTGAGGNAGAGDNPWAPPESGSAGQKDLRGPQASPPQDAYPPQDRPPVTPPSVHDQATMAAVPFPEYPPPGGGPAGTPP